MSLNCLNYALISSFIFIVFVHCRDDASSGGDNHELLS